MMDLRQANLALLQLIRLGGRYSMKIPCMTSVRMLFLLSSAGLSTASANADDSPGGRRIVNGTPARIANHRWQVAFNIDSADGKTYLCGGSLISQRWVLTAAHCLSGATAVRLKYGVTNYIEEGSWQLADKVVLHSAYREDSHQNDIAMVKLKIPISGDVADTVPLASATTPLIGLRLEVTGWGRTSEEG